MVCVSNPETGVGSSVCRFVVEVEFVILLEFLFQEFLRYLHVL